jgi:CrcB protein
MVGTQDVFQVFLGAGMGGALRYALGAWISTRWSGTFPWHTMVINVSGAFLLGLLMAVGAEKGVGSESLRLFLGVGVLGGFTTFSALSLESMTLMERGLYAQGASNIIGSAALGLVAVTLGLLIGRSL